MDREGSGGSSTPVAALRRPGKNALRLLLAAADRLHRRRIVVFYAWPDFARKAEALADLMRRRGLPVVVKSGKSLVLRNQVASSRDLFVGFWNDHPLVYMPRHYVFYNGEPLSVPRWRDNADWWAGMRGALSVWGYAQNNAPIVASLGVPFAFVPFGYAPYYEDIFRANVGGADLEEDVDVLFFGTVSPRRQRVIDQLRSRGVNVLAVTRDNPLHGAALDQAIARAKIVLGIHSHEDPATHIADFARLDHLLSNRRFVLHEDLFPVGSDQAFERIVTTSPYDQLAERCVHHLAHHDERRRIAEASHAWFKRERALDDFIPWDELERQLRARS
jgi:hypothetical protein